jgi:tRNA(fMet)-specific endonuclease VapC
MRYLADTDWLIDVLAGLPVALAMSERLSNDGIALSIISVGELYEGAYHRDDAPAVLTRYREFLSPFPVLTLTEPIMEHFARTRAGLRQEGNLIPDFDLLIASTAVEQDLTLLTRNRKHFERIPGLKLNEPL